MQKHEELAAIIERVDELSPKVILEIGVGKCGTSWCWSKLSSVEHIIAIDLPGGPFGGGPERTSVDYVALNTHAQFDFIAGDSKDPQALEKVKELLDGKLVDFLMIDGDHTYEGVKSDYKIYSPLLMKGGLIAFHDICEHEPKFNCEVRKFWLELKADPSISWSEIEHEPKTWGGFGLIYV